jgi:hypothetical protein
VRRDDALIEAVKIAVEFEPKFNPETGNDFSTPLRWHLKGLKRILVDDEQNHSKRLIHAKEGEVSEELAKRVMLDDVALAKHERRATEEKLEAIPVNHGTGGNGTRIRLDLNGLVVGFQFFSKVSAVKEARQFDYAREITEQLSADLRTLIGIGGGRPTLSGRMGPSSLITSNASAKRIRRPKTSATVTMIRCFWSRVTRYDPTSSSANQRRERLQSPMSRSLSPYRKTPI